MSHLWTLTLLSPPAKSDTDKLEISGKTRASAITTILLFFVVDMLSWRLGIQEKKNPIILRIVLTLVIPLTNPQKIRSLQPCRYLKAGSTQDIETSLWDQFIELHLSKGVWEATSINEKVNPEKHFTPENIFWLLGLIVPVFTVHIFNIPFLSIEYRNNFWRWDWIFLLNKVWLGLHACSWLDLKGHLSMKTDWFFRCYYIFLRPVDHL